MCKVSRGNPVTVWQNLAESYGLAEYGRLWQIAADWGLVTGLDRWAYVRCYGVVP